MLTNANIQLPFAPTPWSIYQDLLRDLASCSVAHDPLDEAPQGFARQYPLQELREGMRLSLRVVINGSILIKRSASRCLRTSPVRRLTVPFSQLRSHAFASSSEGEIGTSASLRARYKASIMRALESLPFLDESGVVWYPTPAVVNESFGPLVAVANIQYLAYLRPHRGAEVCETTHVVHRRHVASGHVHDLAEGWTKSLRRHDGTHIALAVHWRALKS
jgi:hypothetical protein